VRQKRSGAQRCGGRDHWRRALDYLIDDGLVNPDAWITDTVNKPENEHQENAEHLVEVTRRLRFE
jgi:hypothetical protein